MVAHRGSLLYESLRENQNHVPWNERTRMATGLVIRTMTKIVIGPKRATAFMLQNGPAGISHYAETTEVIAPAMANVRGHTDRTVHLIATKASRDAEEVPVLHMTIRGCASLRVELCCLCPCSIPLLYQCCTGCLQISQNPDLHTCPSIRVRARFLPST